MRVSQSLVARPTRISSTPVANGSSVPAWPTLVPRGSNRFTIATTRAEESPGGLSTLRIPLGGGPCIAGRFYPENPAGEDITLLCISTKDSKLLNDPRDEARQHARGAAAAANGPPTPTPPWSGTKNRSSRR